MSLLSIRNISKAYPGVTAASAVNLDVGAGEIVGLVGKNGAGKSTIIRIIAGVENPDTGEILLNDIPVQFQSAAEATRAGVAVVHQELNDIPTLSVGENILLGLRYPKRFGLIDRRRLRDKARAALDAIHMDIDIDQAVSNLSIAERRMIMIARGIAAQAKVMVLDEPTASLSDSEIADLFAVIRRMQEAGVGVVYVSHRLEEILSLTDRVSVMRDGALVEDQRTATLDENSLVSLISGKAAPPPIEREACQASQSDELAIEVSGIVPLPGRPAISLRAHHGEVIGLAGLAGAGRTEILRQIMGADANPQIRHKIKGKDVAIRSPQDAWKQGIALVPEDRRTQGAILPFSVAHNVTIASLRQVRSWKRVAWPSKTSELTVANRFMGKLKIKAASPETRIGTLSGGNQQKAILARCLTAHAEILLLDEPTHGVDVDAKDEIYRLIRRLAAQGHAIIIVSSELKELAGLVDKALVLREGHHIATLEGSQITEDEILNRCFSSGAG